MKTLERIATGVFVVLAVIAIAGFVASLLLGRVDTAIICGLTSAVFAGAAGVAWVSRRRN